VPDYVPAAITIKDLRRYAVARSLFAPTTLRRAIDRLGFIQADPIRAPARAQDLILRHRVKNYRLGDLERRYPNLPVEEDFFVNYGFLPRRHQVLMHPRAPRTALKASTIERAQAVLAYVRERGAVHPRQVDQHFAHGKVINDWGGSSNATTHLLDDMHYRGLLRVLRRDGGVRIYAAHEHATAPLDATERRRRVDALVDVIVGVYAPLPAGSLGALIKRLRYGAPQLSGELDRALLRAKRRLANARIDGVDWYWPEGELPGSSLHESNDQVRLLAPFDPIVWDRSRFELLWGWTYRLEAYTPTLKRKFGYYALPVLWHDNVIGWANLTAKGAMLSSEFGYPARVTRTAGFRRDLDTELERMRVFLRL